MTATSQGADSLAAQLERLDRGEVSSRELVELALGRIEETQPTLNTFRCVRAEAALAEAEQADRRRAAGETQPLLGAPVAIKDDLDLSGEATSFGCRGTFELKGSDAEAVRRLKAAGAVIVGKTNTPELGQWPITEGPAFGATRNPWNLDHTPGGSSGGAAAAVAAGLVPAALGSDGLGSVRIPAAWTNLIGIKPQRGRISTWPDPEPFNGLTCIGPLARTVLDAALLLDAARGNHPRDPHRPPPPPEAYAAVDLGVEAVFFAEARLDHAAPSDGAFGAHGRIGRVVGMEVDVDIGIEADKVEVHQFAVGVVFAFESAGD